MAMVYWIPAILATAALVWLVIVVSSALTNYEIRKRWKGK